MQPVNVTPLQGECFTDSQAKADAQQSHRAEGFAQMLNELLELFHSETARFSCSLRRAFDRYQLHRISLRRYVAAPHRKIPKNAQHSSMWTLLFGASVIDSSHSSTGRARTSKSAHSPHLGRM